MHRTPSEEMPRALKPRVLQMLLALASEPLHGYALMQRIEESSDGQVRVGPATLYRTLDRLEADGLVAPVPGCEREDSRRVQYALTAEGRGALHRELGRLATILGQARRVGAYPGGGGA